jgi:amino acid transporter
MGWQTGISSVAFLAGTQIQGLVVLNNPDYVFERWHGTLICIAVTIFAIFFNTVLAKKLPYVEGMVLFLHVFSFFAILIPLWVLSPRVPATDVFTTFLDGGGWGNVGLACLVGMLSPVFALLGADAATHMGPHSHLPPVRR